MSCQSFKIRIMNKKAIFVLALAMFLPAFTSDASSISFDLSSILPATQEDSSASGYQTYYVNRKHHYRSSSPFNYIDVKYDGDIRVSDNDRSIISISPGGYLKIEIRTFGNSRELIVNSDSKGRLTYEFREGRQDVPFEPEGRKWLEDILLDVIRSSGIDASGRTARLYSRGGLDAVQDEISLIKSNSVMGMYYSALLEEQKLTNRELSEVAYGIAGKMSSNTERGRLFRRYNNVFLANTDVAADYFSAISRLSSSSERGRIYRDIDHPLDFNDPELTEAYFVSINRRSSNTEAGSVLRHTLENQELSVPAQATLLRSVAKLSSNTEAGRVMRSIDELDFSQPLIWESYFAAIDHMSSNTEKSSVLRDAVAKNKLEGAAMIAFLNSTRKMSSNTEKSSVIRSIHEINLDDAGLREAYFNVIRTTTSSTESGRMLRHTLDHHDLNQASMINLFETAKRISSNTEVSSVLRATVPHMIYETPVLDAFFACTNSLSSSTEHGRVLRELASVDGLEKDAITGILYSARKISSNSEKGSVLRAVAPSVMQGSKEMKDLYMESAKTLSSDSEYRRAIEAIM